MIKDVSELVERMAREIIAGKTDHDFSFDTAKRILPLIAEFIDGIPMPEIEGECHVNGLYAGGIFYKGVKEFRATIQEALK